MFFNLFFKFNYNDELFLIYKTNLRVHAAIVKFIYFDSWFCIVEAIIIKLQWTSHIILELNKGIDFRRQIPKSIDVGIWRLKSVPALKI